MCAQCKAGVSHQRGFYKVVAASLLDGFMFPWEETDFCNEMRWPDGLFWHCVCVQPLLANLFFFFSFMDITVSEFLNELFLMACRVERSDWGGLVRLGNGIVEQNVLVC